MGSRFGSRFGRRVVSSVLALFLVVSMLAVMPQEASAHGWGRVKQMDKFVKKMGDSVKKQSDLRFNDLNDALWAAATIAKMRGLGIINGYDGNWFKPNSSVSQAEALVMMIRAFDLEDEAKDMAERFGLTYSERGSESYGAFSMYGMMFPGVAQNSRWALGYILLAVEEGWVKLSECNPEKAASRAWISKVMVRALGHEDQAQAKMNATLPFTDRAAVAAGDVGYVAEAVALGLFRGYDDGTFKPNKAVSRAEMATIIERFLGEELPSDIPYLAVGEVKSVSSNKLSIIAATGKTFNYTVSVDALVIVDGSPASLSNVKVGDVVEVLSNGQGVALLITVAARTTPSDGQIAGEIVGIASPPALTIKIDSNTSRTVTLANNCVIKLGSTTVSYDQLLLGDVVQVTIKDNKATAVTVTSRGSVSEIAGEIVGIASPPALTIKIDSNTNRTVTLATNCVIRLGSTVIGYDQLLLGDVVQVTIQDNQATAVTVTSRGSVTQLTGEIVGIASPPALTLKVSGQSNRTVTLATNCVIRLGSTAISYDQLLLGDVVQVTIKDNKATAVTVTSRSSEVQITGEIIAMANPPALTLKVNGQANRTVTLATYCVITMGGTNIEYGQLLLGDVVQVTIKDNKAIAVAVTSRGSATQITGEIVGIASPPALTLKVRGQANKVVTLATNCVIKLGGTSISYDQLLLGDVVQVAIQDNKATAVTVTSRDSTVQMTGEIVGIASPPALTLKVDGQANRVVTLAANCAIKLGGANIEYGQLLLGDVVKVTIKDNKATAVTVTSRGSVTHLTGEIVGIANPPALTLKVSGQANRVVTLAANCAIKLGGTTIEYGQLLLGDVVDVTIEDNKATSVTVTSRDSVTQVTGEIVGIGSPPALTLRISGQADRVVNLATNCVIKLDGTTIEYGQLLLGDVVQVTIKDNKATAITVTSRTAEQKVTGVIQNISTSSAGTDITVRQSNTSENTLRLSATVRVTHGNTVLTPADLRENDEVEITIRDGEVTGVKITARDVFGDLGGSIKSITQMASYSDIVIGNSGQADVTVRVTDSTSISVGNAQEISRTGLRLGDVIRVKLATPTSPVTAEEIRITSRETTGS